MPADLVLAPQCSCFKLVTLQLRATRVGPVARRPGNCQGDGSILLGLSTPAHSFQKSHHYICKLTRSATRSPTLLVRHQVMALPVTALHQRNSGPLVPLHCPPAVPWKPPSLMLQRLPKKHRARLQARPARLGPAPPHLASQLQPNPVVIGFLPPRPAPGSGSLLPSA